MEDFKYEYYADDHPGKELPVTELPDEVGHSVLERIGASIGFAGTQPELVLEYLFDEGETAEVDILDESFSFTEVVERLALPCSERTIVVICNGPDYRYAVELDSEDVDSTLAYLWYPPADDAIVIDAELKWAFSFAHYGALRYHASVAGQ